MNRFAPIFIATIALTGNFGTHGNPCSVQAQTLPSASNQIQEVVLLKTGRSLLGQVTRAAESVTVTTSSGSRIVVPVKNVDSIFESLEQLYQHRAARLEPADVAGHQSLLHWCLKHRLELPAREQLTELMQTTMSLRRLNYLQQQIDQTFQQESDVNDTGHRLTFTALPKLPEIHATQTSVSSSDQSSRRELAPSSDQVGQVTSSQTADPFDPAIFNRLP